MLALNNNSTNKYIKVLKLCLLFILFQGCKIYNAPIPINKIKESKDNSYVKITMINGDEFIYEAIEIIENTYYGVNFTSGKKVKTILFKEDVEHVQLQNKKASTSNNILGVLIGVLSVTIGAFML